MSLRAMVLGAGSAGEGHALALRQAGAEVVAIASRTAEVVRRVAGDLGIPVATTEWRAALADLRPDIVAVATPGDSHAEMIEAALARHCHIYVDKPVAIAAAAARLLARAARAAGVKTAYAATSNYQPAALLARKLVADGAIGELLEAEFVSHYHWSPLAPFGWPHRLATGGGRLNNNFTHKAAIAEAVAGGVMLAVAGETRNDLKRAPLSPMPHDFRDWLRAAPSAEQAAKGAWAEVDSDWSYTVLARIGAPGTDPADGVSATFRHSCLRQGMHQDYVAFYGSRGTIHIDKAYCQGALHLWREGEESFAGSRRHPRLAASGRAARQLERRLGGAAARLERARARFRRRHRGARPSALPDHRGRLAPPGGDRRRARRRRMDQAARRTVTVGY